MKPPGPTKPGPTKPPGPQEAAGPQEPPGPQEPAATQEPPGPKELGKLRWRCRRGMKELDLLLTRYVDEQYCQAAPAEQRAFRELLEAQDPELYAYCLGRREPPTASLATLIAQITSGRAHDS